MPAELLIVTPRQSTRWRTWLAVFLLVECTAATAWWIAVATSPGFRAAFTPEWASPGFWLSLAPADLILFVGASGLAAWGLARDQPWAVPVLFAHAGAAGYAGLWCLTAAVSGSGPGLAALLMAVPMVVLPLGAWRAWTERSNR